MTICLPVSNHLPGALIDDEDAWALSYAWTSFVTKAGHRYVQRPVKVAGKWATSLLHREIMGAGKGEVVDHRSRDTLDNRRSNLRKTTQSVNILRAYPRGGVYPIGSRWRVQVGGRHLGTFGSREAAEAFRLAEWEKRCGA